jgi:hypothetical protein
MAALPGSLHETTPLGFGTSGLHGGWARRESLRLLAACREQGIRHIDTAPLYGLGCAEEIVGEFLAGCHEPMTVTTKYGLFPARHRRLWETARFLARPIASRAPKIKRLLLSALSRRAAAASASASPRDGPGIFTAAAVRASLENSLRLLRRHRVDVFLLHEALPSDLSDELRRALEDMATAGKIGTWGLGSARQKLLGAMEAPRATFPVLQFDFGVAGGPLAAAPCSMAITHGALAGAARTFPLADGAFLEQLARAVDADLQAPGSMAQLVISAALAANSGGIVLFSSKRAEHIRQLGALLQPGAGAAMRTRGLRALEFFTQAAARGIGPR